MKKNNKNEYDLVIINNCPSFYKINLYNEISKKIKIHIIFMGLSNDAVIYNSYKDDICFSYDMLFDNIAVENRNKLTTFFKLYKIIQKIKFKKIVFGGYSLPELLLLCLLSPKKKNILQTESAKESLITSGWKHILKKNILNRYDKSIVSGEIHKDVLRSLGFKGEIVISKGVGIIYKEERKIVKRSLDNFSFLYVGRLIDVKNIKFIINIFNKLGKKLTIVGKGILEKELKDLSNDNITFLGFLDNKELKDIYAKHHIFILPSVKEAWGLVVEEALYNNCVLLLSNMIGCNHELLIEPNTGVIFDPYNEESLIKAIENIENNYLQYYKNVIEFDIDQKDLYQVDSYLRLL